MIINTVKITNKRIDINYSVIGEWKKFFNSEIPFFVEYSKPIDQVPENIAIIPFIVNILPVAWLFNAQIIVNEIDEEFYNSINEFKQGYKEMYPQLNFLGEIISKRKIANPKIMNSKSAVFFSGGVDAYQTLISHINENPTLVTLWGSDITLEDIEGWNIVEEHTKNVSTKYNLDYVVIKSSFRNFLNENILSEYTYPRVNDGWWHGFQHGIGLIGHMAPYAFQYNIQNIYIASSFTIEDKGKVTCASDPSIDNKIKFSSSNVFHDGYEYNRQQKIHQLCNYVKSSGQKLQLRVCWESSGGSNCCKCEKCCRTILGIIAEKENPRDYGFNYSDKEFSKMILNMRTLIPIKSNFRYKYIQNALVTNYTPEEVDKRLKWFMQMNIEDNSLSFSEKIYKFIGKARKFVRLIKGKLN